jgi:hypothetical protein
MRSTAILLLASLAGCGYHMGGKADLLPDTVHTISVPAFGNATIRYKLTDRMPQAIAREFITRTRYRVVANPDTADAVLHGTILTYTNYPTIFDPDTQRANGADLHVTLQVSLIERATGRVLYQRPNFEISERYQISPVAAEYFEESDFALRRASEQVARQVVTAVLENF